MDRPEQMLREWRLCEIDGAWNGICHLPTRTIFKVEGKRVELIRRSEIDAPSDNEIAGLAECALQLFRSGMVAKKPLRPVIWAARVHTRLLNGA